VCIIALAFGVAERCPLIVAANRDERHARGSAAAGWWPDVPDLLAGRDLVAGGTWLGVSRGGRFAAVTNIFEGSVRAGEHSRGGLVSGFLEARTSAHRYAAEIEQAGPRYAAFNLLLYDGTDLVFVSNRGGRALLEPGVHAFGNGRPGEDWPKADAARDGLAVLLQDAEPIDAAFALLASQRDTGERGDPRDAIFVVGAEFGTRCSTVVLLEADGRARFAERRFAANGKPTGTSRFEFRTR
jgi:uncharacterized protein with NRDE domain